MMEGQLVGLAWRFSQGRFCGRQPCVLRTTTPLVNWSAYFERLTMNGAADYIRLIRMEVIIMR